MTSLSSASILSTTRGGAPVASLAEVLETLKASASPLSAAEAQPHRDRVVAVATRQSFAECTDAFRVALRLCERRAELGSDLEFQKAIAWTAWIANEHTAAVAAGKRALAMEPGNLQTYLWLGWANLTGELRPRRSWLCPPAWACRRTMAC